MLKKTFIFNIYCDSCSTLETDDSLEIIAKMLKNNKMSQWFTDVSLFCSVVEHKQELTSVAGLFSEWTIINVRRLAFRSEQKLLVPVCGNDWMHIWQMKTQNPSRKTHNHSSRMWLHLRDIQIMFTSHCAGFYAALIFVFLYTICAMFWNVESQKEHCWVWFLLSCPLCFPDAVRKQAFVWL